MEINPAFLDGHQMESFYVALHALTIIIIYCVYANVFCLSAYFCMEKYFQL